MRRVIVLLPLAVLLGLTVGILSSVPINLQLLNCISCFLELCIETHLFDDMDYVMHVDEEVPRGTRHTATSWKNWYSDSLRIGFGETDIFWSNRHLISLTWVHLGMSSPHQGTLGHKFKHPASSDADSSTQVHSGAWGHGPE